MGVCFVEIENEIVKMVYAARENSKAADALILKYMPFIKAETSRVLGYSVSESDDELSIAMFAFYEATLSYNEKKGTFLSLASVFIKNSLIDYKRKEKRHGGVLSIHEALGENDERTVEDTLEEKVDSADAHRVRFLTREEIAEFSEQLKTFGLTLSDVADSCPKQERTLRACHRALLYAKKEKGILDSLLKTKKLPIEAVSKGSGVERKTLERHRKYMVALFLAYTNGYEIIRGHLSRLVPSEEGHNI